jgi:hypothetical protein
MQVGPTQRGDVHINQFGVIPKQRIITDLFAPEGFRHLTSLLYIMVKEVARAAKGLLDIKSAYRLLGIADDPPEIDGGSSNIEFKLRVKAMSQMVGIAHLQNKAIVPVCAEDRK